MPTPCYLSVQRTTQGNITVGAFSPDSVGNTFVEGHENEMLVQSVDHSLIVPTDRQSGQPSGQRKHYPMSAAVTLNKAIPLLYNALTSGELLTDVSLKWYRTSINGKQEHFFTVKLTNAVIVDISCSLPDCLDNSKQDYTDLAWVAFSYRRIDWSHEISSTAGSDDWRKPLEA